MNDGPASEDFSDPGSPGDATHDWFHYMTFECCRKCGIVRRRDRKNKPCPGPVRLDLRNKP